MTDAQGLDRIEADARPYQRGVTTAHSSDESGMPDVGISVGLGDGSMLYVGERPGRAGFCIAIFLQDRAIDIGRLEPGEDSEPTELVVRVAAAINGSTP
ncbi:MAG: hypothetical protein AAFU61_08155 [Pseudomonadota bacterium]